MSLIISFIAGFGTFLGGLLSLYRFKDKNGFIAFCLSLSASSMTFISLFELIPDSFMVLSIHYGFFKAFLAVILIFFICYVLFTYFLNKSPLLPKNGLSRVGVLSLITIALHNIPEGIASFFSSYSNINIGIKFSAFIMIHNIPEGISIAVPASLSHRSKKRGVVLAFLCSFFEPLGAIMGYILFRNHINDVLNSLLLIIVAGIMISLSILEIYPEILICNRKKNSVIGLIVGFLLVFISVLAL